MENKGIIKDDDLLVKFFEAGLNGIDTFTDLVMLNSLLPQELLSNKKLYTKFFIKRTDEIATERTKAIALNEARDTMLIEFKDRLSNLQRDITELTTHHFTNKRKGQFRKVVKKHFPELGVIQDDESKD